MTIKRVFFPSIKGQFLESFEGYFDKATREVKMNREQQTTNNANTITVVYELIKNNRYRPPSYRFVCENLNKTNLTTSRGNNWTPKRLFRMLQRNGYRGICGLYMSNIRV